MRIAGVRCVLHVADCTEDDKKMLENKGYCYFDDDLDGQLMFEKEINYYAGNEIIADIQRVDPLIEKLEKIQEKGNEIKTGNGIITLSDEEVFKAYVMQYDKNLDVSDERRKDIVLKNFEKLENPEEWYSSPEEKERLVDAVVAQIRHDVEHYDMDPEYLLEMGEFGGFTEVLIEAAESLKE